ncbi:ABC transporter permease [Tautonia sociabilis]|uniref:Iron export ABC transporter permease subunit FetB n=1 Tax=Tautonia sociabilis TaxID=2080755 RepID=A0A432MLP1_9BACT|nr:iron export ABC transporter permease subunit FetB [Tautonia sociabilis]RUL88334.1 iron export ABC transporter permease subunit FetB [Tautonia sociabilis]
MTEPPVPIPSWAGLAWAAIPVVLLAAVLRSRRLGQARPLLVGSARMAGQLLLLGMVLKAAFAVDHPWVVGAAGLVMLSASAQAVGARQSRPSWSLRLEAAAAMTVGAGLAVVVSTRLALGVAPWYDPPVVIPLLGMILGNSVNGVALAAERLESELRSGADLIERRLSLGASARQAALPALRAAVAAGLTPTINGMMVAGIVSIPGMMTGQLLAGAEPTAAFRYQILIYLAISGSVGLAILVLLSLRTRRAFTPDHQLRRPRLPPDGGLQ